MEQLEIRKLCENDYDEFIGFIDSVFGMDGGYVKYCPSVYEKRFNPCASNYAVLLDGKIIAAAGGYCRLVRYKNHPELDLKRVIISNAAVKREFRGRGYLKAVLNAVILGCMEAGTDYISLWGSRSHYGKFGFENAAPEYVFELNADETKKFRSQDVRAEEISGSDEAGELYEIYMQDSVQSDRGKDDFYLRLRGRDGRVFAFYNKGRISGYAVCTNDEISEIRIESGSAGILLPALCEVMDRLECRSADVVVPQRRSEYFAPLQDAADGVTLRDGEMIKVLNFRNTVRSYMTLRAQNDDVCIPDGKVSFRILPDINGFSFKGQCFSVVSDGGKITVEDMPECYGKADYVLTGRQAQSLFFGSFSLHRMKPGILRNWFPLPLYTDYPDRI